MEGLRAALRQRLGELQSPLAVFQKRWLAGDPTGELLGLLRLWQGGIREPAKRLGVWFSPAGDRALLLVETRASGYDLVAQREVVTAIRRAFADAGAGPNVRLTMSGPGVLATLDRGSGSGQRRTAERVRPGGGDRCCCWWFIARRGRSGWALCRCCRPCWSARRRSI
ncbi:MAG: hypothetical protein V9H25_17810 [Candidatus Competibacter sp.]